MSNKGWSFFVGFDTKIAYDFPQIHTCDSRHCYSILMKQFGCKTRFAQTVAASIIASSSYNTQLK